MRKDRAIVKPGKDVNIVPVSQSREGGMGRLGGVGGPPRTSISPWDVNRRRLHLPPPCWVHTKPVDVVVTTVCYSAREPFLLQQV